MKDDCTILTQGIAFPDDNGMVCPGIDFHPNRDRFKIQRTAIRFWGALDFFGKHHCAFGCAGCETNINEDLRKNLLSSPDYKSSFNKAHEVAGQLPSRFYLHLVGLAKGGCPVCAVFNALQQFPRIAETSEESVFSWESQPCYWTRRTDKTGWSYDDLEQHIGALLGLDLENLPPRLTPVEDYEISSRLEAGKAIVSFVYALKNGTMEEPFFQDNISPEILQWNEDNSSAMAQAGAKSVATGIGLGGEGGNAGLIIEAGAFVQTQKVTVNSDAAEVAKMVKEGMIEAWRLGRESSEERPAPIPPSAPISEDDAGRKRQIYGIVPDEPARSDEGETPESSSDNDDAPVDDYTGPEPAVNSPEKRLNPTTMIVRPEIESLLKELGHTWNWIAPTLGKRGIKPCFRPRIRNTPDAYWRSEIEKAIAAKRETE